MVGFLGKLVRGGVPGLCCHGFREALPWHVGLVPGVLALDVRIILPKCSLGVEVAVIDVN
jgi:hypothetical protein